MSGICLPIDAVSGAPSFPAAQNRVTDAALMQGRTDRALGAMSGFRPGAEPVVSITAARVWSATPSNGTLDPKTGAAVGPFRFAFLSNEGGTLDPADQNFTRYDRLDIQVPDDPPGASPLAAIYVVTKGVAQASPQVPTAPARSHPVGVFTVPNSGNPSFSPTWNWATAAGSITPVRAGVRPTAPFLGQYIYDLTSGLLHWDGSAWQGGTTGWLTSGGGLTITAAAGWSIDPSTQYRMDNGQVEISLAAKRTGATVGPASSTGGLADTLIATLSGAGWVASRLVPAAWFSNSSAGMGYFGNGQGFIITDAHPTSTIAVNEVLRTHVVFRP